METHALKGGALRLQFETYTIYSGCVDKEQNNVLSEFNGLFF